MGNEYREFKGEKRYRFPTNHDFDTAKVNRYEFSHGGEFWYDPGTQRIESSQKGLHIQTLVRGDFGEPITRIILNIDGLAIQFSRAGGESFDLPLPKNENGQPVWEIEEVGAPLRFYTGFDDARVGIVRPKNERYQILTNARFFLSQDQLRLGCEFVSESLSKYGNSFSAAVSGSEKPALVSFSEELKKSIESGALIRG